MNIQNVTYPPVSQGTDELILVVKRSMLLGDNALQGICEETEEYIERIETHKEFLPRSLMEQDPTYKQIIPYLVFMHENKLFLMQRHAKASEKRLQSKMTLGIGGHVRREDMQSGDLFQWAKREFHEEISYNGDLKVQPVGLLNDDSNEVGRVHAGFVFLLHGNSPLISVKSELQSGILVSIETCKDHYSAFESWSALVFDFLLAKKYI